MSRWLLIAGALSVLVLSWARSSWAADRASERARVSLDVKRGVGTEQCIDAPALQRGVETRLQRAVFELNERSAFRIHLRLQQLAHHRWSAELELETDAGAPLGQRTIVTDAAHCSSLDDSITLVLALLVDAPLAASTEPLPEPALAPDPPQPGVDDRAQTVPRAPEQVPTTPLQLPRDTYAPREPWHWEASLGVTLALGALPGVPGGFELGLGAKPAHAPELRLFAGAYQPRDAHAGDGGAGAHFSAQHLGLELCPLHGLLGGARLALCAGQSLGRLHVRAFGYDQNSSLTRLTFALFAHGALGIPLAGRLSLRIAGRLEAPLTRALFTYGTRNGTEGNVFRSAPAVAVLEAGFLVAL